ncbi:MAG: signal peptidase I [Candidatus Taylorbacteria bacterium]
MNTVDFNPHIKQPVPPSVNSFKQNPWHVIREWIQVIVIALAIALPVRYFIAEPFIVSGASMDPTFSTGQFLIVDRLSYHFAEPQRGDVIVFRYPNNPSVYYIKRIIGLPGETVTITNGIVTITKPEDTAFTSAHPHGLTLDQSYVDVSHASHDTSKATLTPGNYFVMGDNRSQSSDSRFWGPLDQKFIIGRAFVRLLPITQIGVWPGEIKTQ